MKKFALLFSVVAVAFAATGCKSDVEKLADDMCACKDRKCIDDVNKKWKDKMPEGDKDSKKEVSDKDKEAFERAMGCSAKAMGVGK